MGRLHIGKCLGRGLETSGIVGSTDQVSKVCPWSPAKVPCGQPCSQWSTRVKYSLAREELDLVLPLGHLQGSWRR